MIHVPVEWLQSWSLRYLLRIICYLKVISCFFLELSVLYFGLQLNASNLSHGKQRHTLGKVLYFNFLEWYKKYYFHCMIFFYLFIFCMVLQMEPKASCMPGRHALSSPYTLPPAPGCIMEHLCSLLRSLWVWEWALDPVASIHGLLILSVLRRILKRQWRTSHLSSISLNPYFILMSTMGQYLQK